MIPSLPQLENEYQRSVNDYWSCILQYLGGNTLQTVIKAVLAAFIRKRESDMMPAPSSKWVSMQYQQLLPLHHGYSQHDLVIIANIHCFNWFCRSKGSRTPGGSSVNEFSCYCPGGCGGNIPYIFAYNACNNLIWDCLWSSATHITQDASAEIVDAPLTLIFNMG